MFLFLQVKQSCSKKDSQNSRKRICQKHVLFSECCFKNKMGKSLNLLKANERAKDQSYVFNEVLMSLEMCSLHLCLVRRNTRDA